jgi:hypothetical protein
LVGIAEYYVICLQKVKHSAMIAHDDAMWYR